MTARLERHCWLRITNLCYRRLHADSDSARVVICANRDAAYQHVFMKWTARHKALRTCFTKHAAHTFLVLIKPDATAQRPPLGRSPTRAQQLPAQHHALKPE